MDNLEFMQWFKRFFELSCSGRPDDYDPINVRTKGKGSSSVDTVKKIVNNKPATAPASTKQTVTNNKPANIQKENNFTHLYCFCYPKHSQTKPIVSKNK